MTSAFRTHLEAWMEELHRWSEAPAIDWFTDDEGREAAHVTLTTSRVTYALSAQGASDNNPKGYLGCIAGTRDGSGGNDLADGPFSFDTWHKICVDIVAYEHALDVHGTER